MKNLTITLILICLTIGCKPILKTFFTDDKETMRELHNDFRAKYGKSPLVRNEMLDRAAQKHAQWMADNQKMSHYEGRKAPWDRAKEEGYVYDSMGENIAVYDTPENTFRAWTHSSGHRRNILGSYVDFGIGVAEGKSGSNYWAVLFGLPRATLYTDRR